MGAGAQRAVSLFPGPGGKHVIEDPSETKEGGHNKSTASGNPRLGSGPRGSQGTTFKEPLPLSC